MKPACSLPRLATLMLLVCVICTSGCASKYGQQITNVNHYPQCYAPINELRKSEFSVEKSAAAGAVSGALLGAAIGYLATGKAGGAAAGAAVGGITGAAAGGIYGKYAQEKDDAVRLASYNSQLRGSIAEVNKVTAAAKVARQCYERQFTAAVSDLKKGRIKKEEFQLKYEEIASGLEEAANILGTRNAESQQMAADYRLALNQERAALQTSPQGGKAAPVKTKKASAPKSKQLSDLEKSTNTISTAVSASQEEERLLRERLASTRQQARDLMS